MQKKISIQVLPEEAINQQAVTNHIAITCGINPANINGYYTLRESIDARSRNVKINLTVQAFINEPFQERPLQTFKFKEVHQSTQKIIIIGGGPAGLFAALSCLENGIQPVILERGKDVKARRRDLAILNKEGIINEDSNYCFGEGGAGTYSDGKLYTRSSKRGDINRILNLLVHFGAEEKILYEAHPHIGTNKLPQIITAMRKQITDAGGQFIFEKKVTSLSIKKNQITAVHTADGDSFSGNAYLLATGHSARDIFIMLRDHHINIEAKPFALGVRIEHPQSLIDRIQYHCSPQTGRPELLPPASYQLVEQVQSKGVFSFCMCPGGIIATASTSPGELVVNGWSPSKRNNPFANSGLVVQVDQQDAIRFFKQEQKKNKTTIPEENDPLLLMSFQKAIEQKAYLEGGGKFIAPAQRMVDFTQRKTSASLPNCSYIRGIHSVDLSTVLPPYINNALQEGFKAFGNKMKGYFTNEAVVVATESRTSSPVRIPRDPENLHHPQIENLYPCGEGAGYAGGIVSAAMDGERVVGAIITKINN
jgi:uncharacterized FAD-dependent dehydrogenase